MSHLKSQSIIDYNAKHLTILALCWIGFCALGLTAIGALFYSSYDAKTDPNIIDPIEPLSESINESPLSLRDIRDCLVDPNKYRSYRKSSLQADQASLAYKSGDIQSALSHSHDAIQTASKDLDKNCNWMLNLYHQRIKYLKADLQIQNAIAAYKLLYAARPEGYIDLRHDFIETLNNEYQNEEAVKYAQKFADLESKKPQTTTYRKRMRTQALYDLAKSLFFKKSFEKSLAAAKQSQDVAKDLSKYYQETSLMCIAQAKANIPGKIYGDGMKEINEAVALAPKDAGNLFSAGVALCEMNMHKQSIVMLQKSRTLHNQGHEAYYNAWIIANYIDMGDYLTAKKLIQDWIAKDPTEAKAYSIRARYHYEKKLFKQSDMDMAMAKKLMKEANSKAASLKETDE